MDNKKRWVSIISAVLFSVDFTVDCIKATLENKDYHWYGVDFETAMPKLIDRLRELKS